MIDIDTEKQTIFPGIKFSSFIAINRRLPFQIFKNSKLLSLIIYIALRVKRTSGTNLNLLNDVNLNVGEFFIGRTSVTENTDLTDAEYRSRFELIQKAKIIEIVETTNKYTKGKWLENSFVDLNLEISGSQLNNQQTAIQPTTNNNTNNTNNGYPPFVFSFNKERIVLNEQYIRVLDAYKKCKGIDIKGEEVRDVVLVIKKMFDSQRDPEEIIKFMVLLRKNECDEGVIWLRDWNINTVQKKLPEFIAGKFDDMIPFEERYPRYD